MKRKQKHRMSIVFFSSFIVLVMFGVKRQYPPNKFMHVKQAVAPV
ncbi:MAG: hypothetical protein WD055_03375 [Candidatus Dependentiae bacterium]